METAAALRDFLRDGVIRNAVNVPSVSPEEFKRLQPFLTLGERLGSFLAQMNDRNAAGAERPLLRGPGQGRAPTWWPTPSSSASCGPSSRPR